VAVALPTAPRLRPRTVEHGSGTALIGVIIVAGALIASVAVTISTYVLAANRARDAADLIALSAAAAASARGDACAAGRRTAEDNGVRLTACTMTGDALDFVMTVTVAMPGAAIPGLPDSIVATAYAGWLGR